MGATHAGQSGRSLCSTNIGTCLRLLTACSQLTRANRPAGQDVSHGLFCLFKRVAPFISDYSIKNAHCRQDRKKQESTEEITISYIPIQFSSAAQSYRLCDPMDCSMSGFSLYHQLPELAQTHIHRVSDATQPSHPLLSPPPTLNFSQHPGSFPMN